MKLIIEINCDNSAFGENSSELAAELATICSDLYRRIGETTGPATDVETREYPLRDSNGNRVGTAKFINQQTPASGMNRDGH